MPFSIRSNSRLSSAEAHCEPRSLSSTGSRRYRRPADGPLHQPGLLLDDALPVVVELRLEPLEVVQVGRRPRPAAVSSWLCSGFASGRGPAVAAGRGEASGAAGSPGGPGGAAFRLASPCALGAALRLQLAPIVDRDGGVAGGCSPRCWSMPYPLSVPEGDLRPLVAPQGSPDPP